MSLKTQLLLLIEGILILMLLGALGIHFKNTQLFITQQLNVHAQDTATALGLSLAAPMSQNDQATTEAIVNAVFDRGYYQLIRVETLAGQLLIDRTQTSGVVGTPTWFINLVPLTTPEAKAYIMSGWQQAATVTVQSHPGYGYRALWQTTQRILLWFGGITLVVVLGGYVILNSLLRPLDWIERQAQAIMQRQYSIQQKLPFSRELRRVVLAMNQLAQVINNLFEEQTQLAQHWRQLAYQDPLTAVGNKRYLEAQFESYIKNAQLNSGALLLVKLNDLKSINDRLGIVQTDELLKSIAVGLKLELEKLENAVLARGTGAEFMLLIPNIDPKALQSLSERISRHWKTLQPLDLEQQIHIGVVLYDADTNLSQLLLSANQAWQIAYQQHVAWYISDILPLSAGYKKSEHWQALLDDIIANETILLYQQPVVMLNAARQLIHKEILARIQDKEGQICVANVFIPVIERLNYAVVFDRLMIKKTIQWLAKQNEARKVALNISDASLADTDFIQWLLVECEFLAGTPHQVFIECAEQVVAKQLDRAIYLATALHTLGQGFGVDKFSAGFTQFGYLRSLVPDYVKLDASYMQHIDNLDSQFFVQNLMTIVHSLNIKIITQAVENEAQEKILSRLRLDGGQGYYFGQPSPLN